MNLRTSFGLLACALALISCQNPIVFPSHLAKPQLSAAELQKLTPPPLWVHPGGNGHALLFQRRPNAPHSSPIILFTHGNAETADSYAPWASKMTRRGVDILLVEYPGYGNAPGRATQSTIRKAAVSAYDYLIAEEGYQTEQVYAVGRSIGTGAVCDLASHRSLAGIVLISPFTRLADAYRNKGFPGFLALGRFDNLDNIASYSGKLLALHGSEDLLFPTRMSHSLIKAKVNGPPGRVIEFPAGHNDLFFHHGDEMDRQILRFVKK